MAIARVLILRSLRHDDYSVCPHRALLDPWPDSPSHARMRSGVVEVSPSSDGDVSRSLGRRHTADIYIPGASTAA